MPLVGRHEPEVGDEVHGGVRGHSSILRYPEVGANSIAPTRLPGGDHFDSNRPHVMDEGDPLEWAHISPFPDYRPPSFG